MILLTGANGFIGKHLLAFLKEKFFTEKILVYTSTNVPGFNCLIYNKNFELKKEEVNLLTANIEYIIHLGAFVPKTKEEEYDIEKLNKNIYSTQTLLSYDYKKLKKIIYISTLDVYEPTDEIITEDTEVSPTTMYGLSKYYCERMIKIWGIKNKIKTQILRMGHVYGPGEEQYSKLIPSVMTSILRSKQVYINGKGENYRCYIFIKDAVNAILESIHNENISEILNIVGSSNHTVSEIVEKIVKISGYEVDIKQVRDDEKKNNLLFDNTKLVRELYSPSYSIDLGLKIEWEYLKNKFE